MRKISDAEASLSKAISYQSTSANPQAKTAICTYLTTLLTDYCDAVVTRVTTGGAPALVATIPGTTPDAVLFYGHYDVMDPGKRADWDSEPFTMTKRGERLYGRGAGDNKGQLLATINGLNAFLLAHPNHKQTIKLLIEGEEEQGSLHLADTVRKLRADALADVTRVIVVDGSMNASGAHVLRLANRGLFGIKLHIKTAQHDNHSGNAGNILPNPVLIFQQILNLLYDANKSHVRIPGFYDGVAEPTVAEWALIDDLPYDAEHTAEVFGGAITASNKRDYYHKLMFEPTFNVSGVASGYNGAGIKTIIPGELTASINMRLVGTQKPDQIAAAVAKLLAPFTAAGVLTTESTGDIPPAITKASAAELAVFRNAAAAADLPLLIEPCMAGTVPNYVWTDILGAQAFTLPLANFDQNNHSKNENMTERAFAEGIRLITALAGEFEKQAVR
jgi:acetylornithine deacetylase/succinyl-diaminopimelate desuccinylase-like protein